MNNFDGTRVYFAVLFAKLLHLDRMKCPSVNVIYFDFILLHITNIYAKKLQLLCYALGFGFAVGR